MLHFESRTNGAIMLPTAPLPTAQGLLGATGLKMFIHHENRIPTEAGAVLVVSNHRSFMDAPVLIQALRQPVRIACHHYMSKTPILREFIQLLGCIPLESSGSRQQGFFEQAKSLLQSHQWVGIFPEGASPMLNLTHPQEIQEFQRGFAHLALKTAIPDLWVLPVAIGSIEESLMPGFPVRLLSLFDPSEPLFERSGSHPVVVYQRINVLIGRPYRISALDRQRYHGKGAKEVVNQLSDYCRQEITDLLRLSF
ncbi:lysophospholipid acyltransferase family protein [Gloeothece verrucosa]|uniref:Phospholipid/glycerol acyltransferase n=1 Tax=Gloeothece verrucosa (strain PCC 7822) TaxID=497965 RepID=E0UHT7_GLOV7|nr:lysophospholipid acyltransferase family protein [Gloeothece verrucosa]ADN13344.1 phospholipid/glycerol acyltransferase [Gloeothece verrucosa PCC 7822]